MERSEDDANVASIVTRTREPALDGKQPGEGSLLHGPVGWTVFQCVLGSDEEMPSSHLLASHSAGTCMSDQLQLHS